MILAVGAVWRADYELYAHSAAARKAGISEGAIKTLVGGGIPDELTEDKRSPDVWHGNLPPVIASTTISTTRPKKPSV